MRPATPDLLPISEVEWQPLIPLIVKANRSLAFFNGVLRGIPNPDLLLSPMTTHEAVLSSKLEGTQATLGEVLKYEAGEEPVEESKKQDIGEIINYRAALARAIEVLGKKPFHLNLLLELHSILLNSVRGRTKDPGRFRTTQNWIGPPGSTIDDAYFVPPEHTLLPKYLDNFEKYYHEETLDSLVQLAIIHAQFEILHPFCDGNGRLGRMLVPLFLYEKNILTRPMFYISEYLESNRDMYVNYLRPLGKVPMAWNAWIGFFLNAIDIQAQKNATKAENIMHLYDDLKLKVLDITHSQYAIPLLDFIFNKPIFQARHLKNLSNMPSYPMISNMLKALRDAGILVLLKEGRGRIGNVFALPALVNVCEGRDVILT
ncbi:MAG: cell filamentation protein Fic [Acidobacteria bacterium]|nr:MAG: cell filamentation protein Fic [Acidobacteriota bacterium]